MFDLLVRNASEVITAQGSPEEEAHDALRIVPRGAVGVRTGRIAWIGPEEEIPADAIGARTEVLDAHGGCVTPGLVDPHTHLVFAGDRAEEFDLRNRGASYLEIAQAGGGIMSTVRATRAATEDELVQWALPRLHRLLKQGVTYAEVKSGYGLDLDSELKMLRAVKRLASEQPIELIPTLLCAHAIPEEFKDDRDAYIALCINEIIPAAAQGGLARFCDAFAEESAFTLEETRRVLQAGIAHSLRPRLHVDQLTALGGSQLAAELGAACADHLEYVSDSGIEALARAGVSAVLVPTSTLYLRMQQWAPGRRLAGAEGERRARHQREPRLFDDRERVARDVARLPVQRALGCRGRVGFHSRCCAGARVAGTRATPGDRASRSRGVRLFDVSPPALPSRGEPRSRGGEEWTGSGAPC